MPDFTDTPKYRLSYLLTRYRRHPVMPLLTVFTIVFTSIGIFTVPRHALTQSMVILLEDTTILLWVILFFFYSDKLIFIYLSNERYEKLKNTLTYVLNENHVFIWSIVMLILISIGLIIVETVFALSEQTQHILWIADIVVLTIFLVEFYLRYVAAGEDKITHFTRAETIIDMLALFPLLRVFRLMRFIRLLRFLRVAKFRRYLQSLSDSVAVFAALWSENVFNIVIIFVLVIVFLFFGTITIYHFEHPQKRLIHDLPDALWWTMSLIFAGQPLDDVEHLGSRMVGFVLLLSGIIITSILTGTIAATLSDRLHSVKTGTTHFYFREHIVICGWREQAQELISYLHQHMGKKKKHIVVIDDSIDELPPMGKDVYFIKGNPASENVLVRANAHHAGAAIILSGKGEGLYADQKTILSTLAVESLSRKRGKRDIHTCSELVHPVNAKNLARAYVNEMILVDEYSDDIIVQSALIPGLIDLMNELLTNDKGDNNIYKIVAAPFAGKSFREVYRELIVRNVIPIGVLREQEEDNHPETRSLDETQIPEKKYTTIVNPQDENFILTREDRIFVISRPDDIRRWEVAKE